MLHCLQISRNRTKKMELLELKYTIDIGKEQKCQRINIVV